MDNNFKLALFFSHGISLSRWKQVGIFDREVGYYKELAKNIGQISFLTYDDDAQLINEISAECLPINIYFNHRKIKRFVFSLISPFLFRMLFQNIDILKTNQLSGAWTAVIAKYIYRKPLIVRCGFVPSAFAKQNHEDKVRLARLLLYEKIALFAADRIFVVSDSDKEYIVQNHHITADKIKVIPNPIDTDKFKPNNTIVRRKNVVTFVGRISKQKNIDLLIDACERLNDVEIWIVGGGSDDDFADVRKRNTKVVMHGVVSNDQLPVILNQSTLFVLPSKYEGTPKALLEAMSCAVPVIGTNVVGIKEIIVDEVSGLLCEPTADALAKAIERAISDVSLQVRLGKEARKFVLENFSQRSSLRIENQYINQLLRG